MRKHLCLNGIALALGLLSSAECAATVRTASQVGNWSSATTWGGAVPRAGEEALIPSGITVTQDVSSAKLKTLTIHGALVFSGWKTVLKARAVTVDGTITHLPQGAVNPNSAGQWIPDNRVQIACTDLSVSTGGTINVCSMGYRGGATKEPENGYGPGGGAGPDIGGGYEGSKQRYPSGGAGHGGIGGITYNALYGFTYGAMPATLYDETKGVTYDPTSLPQIKKDVGLTYGHASTPLDPGSGGGGFGADGGYPGKGGPGGGAVRIEATGVVLVDGSIRADGSAGEMHYGGGGSGGSVYIICSTLQGTGVISANGGDPVANAGGGAGGRIAVSNRPEAQAGSSKPRIRFSVNYGINPKYSGRKNEGQRGSIWLSSIGILDSEWMVHTGRLILPRVTNWAVDNFRMTNGWLSIQQDGFSLTVRKELQLDGEGVRLDVGGRGWLATNQTRAYYSRKGNRGVLSVRKNLVLKNGGVLTTRHPTITPIDWKRFAGKTEPNDDLVLSGKILLNSARWGSQWIPKRYRDAGDRYLVRADPARKLSQNALIAFEFRDPASVALGLATVIRTGLFDAETVGVSEEEVIHRVVKVIKGLASSVWINGGTQYGVPPIGYGRQPRETPLNSALLGRAAWMMWKDLDQEARDLILRMIVAQADWLTTSEYSVRYWNGDGPASHSERSSSDALILQLAVAMMPNHPNVTKWKEVCSELHMASYARPSDMNRATPILDGKAPKDWLKGYCMFEEGFVVNHGLIHPDYMVVIANSQMQGFLVSSLGGVPVPETTDWNFDVVYKSLIEKKYVPGKPAAPNTPNVAPPGGTMYVVGSPVVYYPTGTDWSNFRFDIFYNMDAYAAVLEYDANRAKIAREWLRLRGERILEMQSRHDDGASFARGEFDTLTDGTEEMALWMLADSYLVQWLAASDGLSKKANWFSD